MSDTQQRIQEVCDSVKELLLEKNRKYGDSALNPTRIFSKSDTVEQIKVRIDDKLSRISTSGTSGVDEDTLQDLIGYLVLLKIATENSSAEPTPNPEQSYKEIVQALIENAQAGYGDFSDSTSPDIDDQPLSYWDSDENWMVEPKHSEHYYDTNRNKPFEEWNLNQKCGWDPNSGPTC